MSNSHNHHAVPRGIRAIEDFLDIERARHKYSIDGVTRTNPNTIGVGSRGDVYEGHIRDGNKVAIKIMRGTTEEALTIQKRIIRELVIWSRLDHENVGKFYGLAFNLSAGAIPGIVTSFIDYDLMAFTLDYPLTRPRIICEIALGVEYLHGQFIIHGDLRPDNVRVSRSQRAKIIDFGMGKIAYVKGFTTHWSPHPRYFAPELVLVADGESVRPTFQSDIYSLAMLMLQVFHGRDRDRSTGWDSSVPFNDYKIDLNIYSALRRGRKPCQQRYRNITAEQWSFFDLCWNKDPSSRPSIGDVVTSVSPP